MFEKRNLFRRLKITFVSIKKLGERKNRKLFICQNFSRFNILTNKNGFGPVSWQQLYVLWESVTKHKKVWQNTRKCVKTQESVSKHQKVCQIIKNFVKNEKVCHNLRKSKPQKCVKTWICVSKHEYVCQNMNMCVKTWKSVTKHKKVCQNMRKCWWGEGV